MGLDIAFDRDQAIEAGLVLTTVENGTPAAIARAEEDNDQSYARYLRGKTEYVHVPDTHMLVANGGLDCICVRANKWGRVYEPMTKWLKDNNIEWSEG